MLNLSLHWHSRGSATDVFTSAVRMVVGSAHLGNFYFVVVVVACFMGAVFLYIFQNFPNFCVEVYSLGLGVRFKAGVGSLWPAWTIDMARIRIFVT